MRRILAILGSPRRWGNAELFLEEFLKEFKDKKFKIKKIVASELNITPCNNCGHCLKRGVCLFKDDMDEVYKELKKADCVVVASPIYFTNLPGQLKILIDRCQVFWAKPVKAANKRYGVFLSVCGSPSSKMFNCALVLVRVLFKILNIELYGKVTVPGVDKKGDILKREEALLKTRRLANRLIEHIVWLN